MLKLLRTDGIWLPGWHGRHCGGSSRATWQLLTRAGAACLLAAGACALMAAGTARAAVPGSAPEFVSHNLSGHETAVWCLTRSRCVAVGSRRSSGAVVTLLHGRQIHASVLRRSSVIDSVSCPSKSGCWAIGHPKRGAGAYLVKVSSAGRPVAERKLALPNGAVLGPISCTSMQSCMIAGADNRARPPTIEIGDWNGKKLHLHRVRVNGSAQVLMSGISCWHAACEAVGHARVGSAEPPVVEGLILTVAGGTPGTLRTSSDHLSSISCISATTCYAAGGITLYTVAGGVATDPQSFPGIYGLGWNGIECHPGGSCEAAGSSAVGSAANSQLVSMTNGTAGRSVGGAGGGYSGIAPRGGSGFIAIGIGGVCPPTSPCQGTVVTIG